jgi:hypothetical protein
MISDDRLAVLAAYCVDGRSVLVKDTELLELIRAYEHHKRVLPLHQAIAEACKKLGY